MSEKKRWGLWAWAQIVGAVSFVVASSIFLAYRPPPSPVVRARQTEGVVVSVSYPWGSGGDATVRVGGERVRVDTELFPRLNVGDHVEVLERTHADGARSYVLPLR